MAKIKKISVNAFEKVMNETYNTPTESFDWNGIEVTVKKTLSLKEMLEFVDGVVKSCFTEDTNTYMPEIRNFATNVCVLEKYANLTMPRSVAKQYELIYQTNIVDEILAYINQKQFDEIRVAITKKIDHIAQANIEAVTKQMNELYSSFDNLQTQFAALFDGISGEDIQAMTTALMSNSLDEEKIVKAYINQSDNNNGEK